MTDLDERLRYQIACEPPLNSALRDLYQQYITARAEAVGIAQERDEYRARLMELATVRGAWRNLWKAVKRRVNR